MTRSDARSALSGAFFLRQFRLCGIVSALYVWAYFATIYLAGPVQQAILPTAVMSLVFLPHGVRVLAAWLYGWRSVTYLLLGAVLCNLHFAGDRALAPEVLAGTAVSLLSAPLALAALRRVAPGLAFRVGETPLRKIVVLGAVASVLNLSGLAVAYGLAPLELAVTLLGDMTGLLIALAILRGAIWAIER